MPGSGSGTITVAGYKAPKRTATATASHGPRLIDDDHPRLPTALEIIQKRTGGISGSPFLISHSRLVMLFSALQLAAAGSALVAPTFVNARSLDTGVFPRSHTLTSPLGPVVDLGYAAYAGNSSLPGLTFYGGIPYTQPPVGNLRFAPPKKLVESHKSLSNSDVIDARNWGAICIQQPAVVGIGSEDCVTLNVWKPAGANPHSKLPVYVYIHGGGHYYNSAQGFPANDWVARSNGGLIAVAIQYRLGMLGFLSGNGLRLDRSAGPNNGLLDQRAALEWIQRNIAAFGGDPSKVTIGGESSGGGSVALHMTAYGGERNPPFRAVVMESPGNDPFYDDSHTEQCFLDAIAHIGCPNDNNVVACLRKATVGAIVSAVNNKLGTCKYEPIIDWNYVVGITSELLETGRFSKVPILGGHNAQDGSIFVGKPAQVTTDADMVKAVLKRYPTLSQLTTEAMLKTYPPASASTPWKTQWERTMWAYMESELSCWPWYIGNISGKPAYNYRWDAVDPNIIAARGAYVGAAHTAELFYLYDGTNSGPSASVAQPVFTAFKPAEADLAKQAVAWWSSFAMTLDPNTHAAPGAPRWEPASQNGGFMVPNTGASAASSAMSYIDADYPRRCAWWRSVAEELRL
ncbi:unnamed protein product [Mycena citricolor]|uniref:Carboxylic ester hydrolase n=1 Tax=Mycena citricolor TaxID=2018698 RepID=A0AAD2Q1E7_9AGAR|nr:unnamed protein product [Mycena citricolor]